MEWFEDESLWRELYPYVFPLERVAAAVGQVTQLLDLAGVTGGAVLDLCCGPGRHAVEFARRGFVVTGVDRSPFLLERARERALASALEVEWVLDDMRHFERPASFHLACNLFTSFGYFEREEDNLRVLANIRESLRDGGALGRGRATPVLPMARCSFSRAMPTPIGRGWKTIGRWSKAATRATTASSTTCTPDKACSIVWRLAASLTFTCTAISPARPTVPRLRAWWRWRGRNSGTDHRLAWSVMAGPNKNADRRRKTIVCPTLA